MGYITGYSHDCCQANDLYDKFKMRKHSCLDPKFPDHVFLQATCSDYDGGVGGKLFNENRNFGPHLMGGGKTCFMEQPLTEMGFKYLRSWMNVYKGKRKYYNWRSALNHNNYGEGSHDLDDSTSAFLKDILGPDGSKAKNLIIRIYSDHGNHQNKMQWTLGGDYERHLPLMMTLYPKAWAEHHKEYKLKETLDYNRQRFSSSMDAFWTDLGIIGGTTDLEGNKKKYGWFTEKVREERKKIYKEVDSWDQKNWGKDVFAERLENTRSCRDLPFFMTYRLNRSTHCHCKLQEDPPKRRKHIFRSIGNPDLPNKEYFTT